MSTPGATFDLMAEACSKAAVLLRINGIPTIISINELVKATKQVATSLNTRMWGGTHGCPALVLEEAEIRHVANNPTLNCNKVEKPPFTHPEITPLTTVTVDEQLTKENKVT